MTDIIPLKPCPFCGSPTVGIEFDFGFLSGECYACQAAGPMIESESEDGASLEDRRLAAEAWNRRA